MDIENAEICSMNEELALDMAKWLGTTVTIYTTSGGASGCGFTGVLAAVDPCLVRLITCLGPAPCCSLGSACVTPGCPTFEGGRGGRGYGRNRGNFGCISNVGSTVVIPVDRIAAFIHCAI